MSFTLEIKGAIKKLPKFILQINFFFITLSGLRHFIIATMKASWYQIFFRVFNPFLWVILSFFFFLLWSYRVYDVGLPFTFIWCLPCMVMLSCNVLIPSILLHISTSLRALYLKCYQHFKFIEFKMEDAFSLNFSLLSVYSLSEWNRAESGQALVAWIMTSYKFSLWTSYALCVLIMQRPSSFEQCVYYFIQFLKIRNLGVV